MEIKRDLMIHLGYGKYWRSDDIVGLLPIEEGRGPGMRTEVYVASTPDPIVASRTESSILQDMASLPEEAARVAEVGTLAEDLLDVLNQLSPVLRRMLRSEANFDVDYWRRRLRQVAARVDEAEEQEDLFGE